MQELNVILVVAPNRLDQVGRRDVFRWSPYSPLLSFRLYVPGAIFSAWLNLKTRKRQRAYIGQNALKAPQELSRTPIRVPKTSDDIKSGFRA